MAITDVPEFVHLTDADIESLAIELDAIRQDIEDSRGERDARYIRRTIAAQRALDAAGRLMLTASSRRSAWWAGAVTLGVAKIVENMEIGHNVMHGQWDWMNDPEIHSSTWEWDINGASKHWRFTHNFMHHKYTNILGMDDDLGYGMLRVTRDQRWKPFNLANVLYSLGQYARSGERYRQVVELDPDFWEAWNNLGTVLSYDDDNEEAVAAYFRALRLNPRYADAHYNVADTLEDLGRIEEARDHWLEYLELEPHGAWAEHARERLRNSDGA